jgi:hypothetical protein
MDEARISRSICPKQIDGAYCWNAICSIAQEQFTENATKASFNPRETQRRKNVSEGPGTDRSCRTGTVGKGIGGSENQTVAEGKLICHRARVTSRSFMPMRSDRLFNMPYRGGAEVFCYLQQHVSLLRITANDNRICHFDGIFQSEV